MVRFSANTVIVDDSNKEFILVGFADEQSGDYREALHFQRSHEFDEQDAALGMDGVYVERNDQWQGGYCCVERVELYTHQVRVLVSGNVAERMGDHEFEILLSLSPEEFERLRNGMRVVFQGTSSLVEYPDELGPGSPKQ